MMELKVWVEGIQRIVCGVTETTTCQVSWKVIYPHFILGCIAFNHFSLLVLLISNVCLKDVVYALAHATGKTGRFTLIERWRNNERLLAPHEHPLKVWSVYGLFLSWIRLQYFSSTMIIYVILFYSSDPDEVGRVLQWCSVNTSKIRRCPAITISISAVASSWSPPWFLTIPFRITRLQTFRVIVDSSVK